MSPIINLFPTTAPKPIAQAIDDAYQSFNVPPLGGPSVDGWSKLNDFQRCPYRYWLIHEQSNAIIPLGETPFALEVGTLFHAMLAMHYAAGMSMKIYPTAYELAERVFALGGNQTVIDECKRLYTAYFNHYGNPVDEGITPLGVEIPAGIEGTHTCRFDMLARINGGIWIVEHKTASRESRDTIEGWWLDGEILGEAYGYKLSELDRTLGPLVGVLVNVVIKTNVPKFRRIEVVVTDQLLTQYKHDSAFWRGSRNGCKQAEYWPRKLNGCIGRYDTCCFFDHCRDAEATDDERLRRMLELSLRR